VGSPTGLFAINRADLIFVGSGRTMDLDCGRAVEWSAGVEPEGNPIDERLQLQRDGPS
jgi:hypothetical protein